MALALLKTWSRSWYSEATSGMSAKGWKVERMLASGSGNDTVGRTPLTDGPGLPVNVRCWGRDDEAQITLNNRLTRGV